MFVKEAGALEFEMSECVCEGLTQIVSEDAHVIFLRVTLSSAARYV